jgi:AcrR family transcriptional regulator
MAIDRTASSAAAERILRAAIEVFAESGYGGSSTREITKRLNMSATAIYPHFASKEELLYAIALDGHSSLLQALHEADERAGAGAGNPTERLKAVVAVFASWHAENRKRARVVHYELHGLTSAHYRSIGALRRQTMAFVADIVTAGAAAGEFHVDNVDDVVVAISSLCVDVCRWFPTRQHNSPHKLGAAYADIAERMLR